MSRALKMNEMNQLEKGTVIFEKGKPVYCIGALIKGSVRIRGEGVDWTAGKGALLAVSDLFFTRYAGDYIAEEDIFLYLFPIADMVSLQRFLKSNASYRGIMVCSMASELSEYRKGQERLYNFVSDVQERLQSERKDEFQVKCEEKKLSYYEEYLNIPLEDHRKYYQYSESMAFYQADEIIEMLTEVLRSIHAMVSYLAENYHSMTDEPLFAPDESFSLDYLEEKFDSLWNAQKEEDEAAENQDEEDFSEAGDPVELLKNSLQQIFRYANTNESEGKEIRKTVKAFLDTKDRLSTQDDVRKLKKKITSQFFKLYTDCIFKWLKSGKMPLAVKLFLNYGYMDENLLEEDQLRFLCKQVSIPYHHPACRIYTMPEWLKAIYEGKKEPSRNSFEQDYRDFLREEKRSGNITEEQEKEYLKDDGRRVRFEIDNMFTSTNKIVNGKLSSYVPILYKEEIYGHLDRLYLSKEKLCSTILELEKKDFTVFQREVLYSNPELKIEKEHIIKRVCPDIILAPVYGTASSMWQEITGKKRDTPGRFIFPVITEVEIDKLVTKAFGRLHWEYCRCEQGTSWNNIQYKSLTSEYMDYIQYYRKNSALSEEKKEKVKTQITKARNNSREIFLIDYELWIYYESKAAMKLNKVSRAILGSYCPFNKEIREFLKTNAAFEEALMKFQKKFGEKKKEWDLRIKKRENKGLVVPKEFYDTYEYYANN